MSHSYYQQTSPAWGTNQYQFGPPPPPNFQSQPSWGGMDFYRAHAHSAEPALFDHAWSRVRDHTGLGVGPVAAGVGTHEARHWHRRAYGGIGELGRMLPAEIGHAAAYEAYRTWIHNSSIYEPLSGDPHRQREGLVGLAVAEATRLLPYAGRHQENFARMTATEAAAATASIMFYQGREDMMHGHRRSRSRDRYSSGSSYGDPYAYDDAIARPRHRSSSRHRSGSHSGTPVIQIRRGHSPMPGGYPAYGSSMAPPVAPSYSQHSSYGSYSGSSMPMNMPTAYPQPTVMAGSYQGAGMPITVDGRGRSLSTSYPGQTPYVTTLGGAMMVQHPQGIPQQQTIIVTKPRKHKHKHHHGHRHRSSSRSKRSRSISPYRDHYPEHYPRY